MNPSVCTVVSCGATKQDLEPGEEVPAREMYTSPAAVCKDRYARHSHGHYIMSAEYGLVHHATEIAYYDRTLGEMTERQCTAWARDVARDLRRVLADGDFDAVVLLGKADTYVGYLEPHFDRFPAAVLTPWKTSDNVSGIGKAQQWCNDESNWPENVSRLEDIGRVVSPAPSEV